jgi:uncharacterized spore protein YtfJ
MEQIKDLMAQVGEQLAATASSDVVVGTPIQVGTVTIVPLSRISLGLGVGAGSGEQQKSGGPLSGKGGGTGGGAKVRPVGAVVFSAAGVEVLSLPDKPGKLDRLLDAIPGLIDRFQRVQQKIGEVAPR